jgi:NADPH-dependent curcumin reductase CurA
VSRGPTFVSVTGRRYQLVRRPVGLPVEADFEIVSVELGDPSPDEVLVQNVYFSVDPYHREEMAELGGWELHAPLEGRTIGRVIASGVDAVPIGELVVHRKAYSTHALVTDFRRIVVPDGVPISAYLGILGGTGLTAWVGLTTIGGLQAGESVLITAAAGGVGTAAGHIAKALGAAKVVGVTGSDDKAGRLLRGPFDEVVNYRTTDLYRALTDRNIDLCLEDVGGDQFGAAIEAARDPGGRIAWVGAVGQYNDLAHPPPAPYNLFDIVGKQLRVEGYLVKDHVDQRDDYEAFMVPLVQSGQVPVEESVTLGFGHAIEALRSVLTGGNYGKQLVHLVADRRCSR